MAAVSENTSHGLRRTNADKRRAVEVLLTDPEWSIWGDREIARLCGIGYTLVGTVRRELSARGGQIEMDNSLSQSSSPPADSAETRLARRGESVYLTRVGGRGNAVVEEPEAEVPEAAEEEDSQEEVAVDPVGAPTTVTEAQERESESSVSPGKGETSVEEDAVYVAGAAEAVESPRVEVASSEKEDDDTEEEDVEEEEEEEEEEEDTQGQEDEDEDTDEVEKDVKPSERPPMPTPQDAWKMVLDAVRMRPQQAPLLIKAIARAGGVNVLIEGATDKAPEASIRTLESLLRREYDRLAAKDYPKACSSQEQLFYDLQQTLLERQPQSWGDDEEGEEDYED